MEPMDAGDQLYAIVEEYAALGEHRSGSAVDQATASWFGDRLRSAGLRVEHQAVPFERWVGDAMLRVDGDVVGCLPVPYEFIGELDTDAVEVAAFDPRGGGLPEVIDAPVAAAKHHGADAVVLVTSHPEGSLVAVNRNLGSTRPGFPVVLAAGRDLARLQGGSVSLRIEGRLEPGRTSNVVAANAVEGTSLVLTTPLNGWFACAGERGTGIAVLLSLVDRFRHLPLLVVATGGHELGCIGAHHFVAETTLTAGAVAHIGASVAVDAPTSGGSRELISTRTAMTSLDADDAAPVSEAVREVELSLSASCDQWLGEGEAWAKVGLPLLSFTGAGIDFHTPEDTPARATSPEALGRVAEALGDAIDAFIALGDNPPRASTHADGPGLR